MTQSSLLRTDGLYRAASSSVVEGVTAYLRFFSDGAVLRTSSTGTAEEVGKWLSKGMRAGAWNVDGAYTLNGDRVALEFKLAQDKSSPHYNAKVADGRVEYIGRVDGEGRLILRCVDHIEREQSKWTFTFVSVKGLR